MLRADHVAIVGGGFSGTLLAINLLRFGAMAVTLVERRPERLGMGTAFGSARPDHILNVRAGNMSAFPDQPRHFADWLAAQDPAAQAIGSDTRFATRADYGRYLSGLLDAARASAGGRLTILADQAVGLRDRPAGHDLLLASGNYVRADIVVLAPGNLPPHDLPPVRHLAPPLYLAEPWGADIADGLGPDDAVLLLGTGLTAVDCAQTLDSAGFRGRIVALSRRGLLPHSHAATPPAPPLRDRPRGGCADLLRQVRALADEIGWRNAVDALRPFTQDIWRAAAPQDRARFLRHLRPWWDVHRHRIAPQVAQRIAGMQARGQLEVQAGRLESAVERASGVEARWRLRGTDGTQAMRFARIVNCTGPLSDLSLSSDPLLRGLADRGMIRPDALATGIDVDREGHAIAADGRAQERLMIVGPMTRGAHWEIVAVPDLRRQCWTLARTLTGSHWVEAEGL